MPYGYDANVEKIDPAKGGINFPTFAWTMLLRCPHTHKADDILIELKMKKKSKEVMPILPLS